jgi:predicted RNase H-like HicB family nuclease
VTAMNFERLANRMETLAYAVRLEPAKEGGYVVTCRDLSEVVTQGDDLEEALAQASDAMDEAFAASTMEKVFQKPRHLEKENTLSLQGRT